MDDPVGSNPALWAAGRRGYETAIAGEDYPQQVPWEQLPEQWRQHWLRVAAAILGKASFPIEPTDEAALGDEVAVNSFSRAMLDKMARSRVKGRGGWQGCGNAALWEMLREHFEKGDPVDVANFAMMIWSNTEAGRG